MPFNPLSDEIKKYLLSRGERSPQSAQVFPDVRSIEDIRAQGLADRAMNTPVDTTVNTADAAQRPLRSLTAEDEPTPFSQRVPAFVSPETNQKTDELLSAAEQRLGINSSASLAAADLDETIDVPALQAQAELPKTQIPHTEDVSKDLKADDNAKKEQIIADESLRSTDPIEYMRRKMRLEDDELKKAQAQADLQRNVSGFGQRLLESGYLFKNMQLPEEQRKAFEQSKKEANIPVERVKERRAEEANKADLFGKTFDLATKDLDFARKQRLTDPKSSESRAVTKLMSEFLPDDLQHLKTDPDFQNLSAMDQKEFIEKALEKRMSLDALKASREQTAAYKDAQLALQKEKSEKQPEDKLTPGQESTDKEFAKHYATWLAEKGSLSADKSLANVEESIKEMKKNPKLTGGFGGLAFSVMPESLKSAVNEKIGKIDSRLRSAVVDTLRPLLGAQFAAVEGERIMKQTFDANQSMPENIKRAELVLADLKRQVDTRKKAVQHWEANKGSLAGYKGFEEVIPSAVQSQFKVGDRKQKNGKWYVRDESGKWFPEAK